jgi:ubiquitin-like-conjugating enzyme ATG3
MAGLSMDDSKPKDDEIPDMDDIPDMEGEGLEEEGDDAAVQVVKPTA